MGIKTHSFYLYTKYGTSLVGKRSSTDNYHKKLKEFIDGFHGVSTKYLNNYLTWYSFIYQCNHLDENIAAKLLTLTLKLGKKICNNQLSRRPAIPLP